MAVGLSGSVCNDLHAQAAGVRFTNGVEACLQVPYSPRLVPQTGLTVEAWITYDDNLPAGGTRFPTALRQNEVNGSESWYLRVEAGSTGGRQLRFLAVTTAGTVLLTWQFASGQLTQWTHVAATVSPTTATLFINGSQVATTPATGAPLRDLGGAFRVGKGVDSAIGAEVWNGDIDEVHVWPFARSAAEIQSTIVYALHTMPGGVVTWNFDSALVDSSSGLAAAAVGSVPFVNNSLGLLPVVGPQRIGTSTPGCRGEVRMAASGVAQVGNTSFALACAPAQGSTIGLYGLTLGTLPASFQLLGVDVWLDPTVLLTFGQQADPLGLLRLAVPIPTSVPLGFTFAAQVLVFDTCGAQGLAASDALRITVQ